MGYDFSRFSPQSFERFAQALTTKTLGPGISVFGAGPDGAREASFQGPLSITTHGAPWDGYVVAQSKYKSVARGGVEDATWLQNELAADLDKFLDTKRNLKKPEYYLAITNVTLSSVVSGSSGRKGGQEKIEELFESYKSKIGLRGWLVWHADLLSAMLDSQQEIRVRYSAWITEGDVLASALNALKKPSVTSVVPLALRRDLRKDRDIRRKDAGQITEKRIYLEDVFVDLPVDLPASAHHVSAQAIEEEDKPHAEIEDERDPDFDEDDDPVARSAGLVARLVERCADKLDPQSLKRRRPQSNRSRGPTPNRVVLLGGPGQGKSTVAQFLAQVSRARVSIESLRNEPPDLALEAAESILSRAQQEGINLSGPARFPMHVELPKFADAIKQASDQGEKLSLLRHCSNLLGRESDQKLDPADLRTWLGEYPWLLILDGLDEVPATGNRADVVVAVNEFLDDVNHVGGDVLVVITTRPQGYGDDFPRRHWEHWPMKNLAPEDAMRFATRLADVLLSDGTRRDEILSELKRASEDPATAPIMVSPLQVSILFSLVETRGGVPADRWSLFQRHYILLRDREAAKEGDAAKLLRDYTSQIDQIHYDAGFLLHVRAEASGTANAFLSEHEFELLINHQLASEGHRPESIESVKHRLVKIATDRLVLLGSKTGGQIAFDVRSLQEFMAAARIMSSPEASIADRLSDISARTHWRHVFRIAASKAFALTDLTHLRKQIVHICDALDKGDLGPSDRVALSGARLALDLLIDNVSARLPDIRRSLVTRALDLLILGPNAVDPELVRFLDTDTRPTFEAKLVEHLSYAPSRRSDAAFRFLLQVENLNSQFSPWAFDLLSKAWPSEPSDALRLIHSTDELPKTLELRKRLFEAQIASDPQASIHFIVKSIGPEPFEENTVVQTTPCLQWLGYFFQNEPTSEEISIKGLNGNHIFTIHLQRLSKTPPLAIPEWIKTNHEWDVIRELAEFILEPCSQRLAALCRTMANKVGSEGVTNLALPWPLELVLAETTDKESLRLAADSIEQGSMGDIEDWLIAEENWTKNGVDYSAIWIELPHSEFRFVNSPNLRHASRIDDAFVQDAACTLLELFNSTITEKKARWVLQRLLSFTHRQIDTTIQAKIIQLLLSEKGLGFLSDRQFISTLRRIDIETELTPQLLARLNHIGSTSELDIHPDSGSMRLSRIYQQNRNLRGLLALQIPLDRAGLSKQLAARLGDIPVDALQPAVSNTPTIKMAIDMIRLIRGLGPIESMSGSLSNMATTLRPIRLIQFSRLIRSSPWLTNEDAIAILTTLCEGFGSTERRLMRESIEILKSKLDTRSSKFDESAVVARLSLPALSLLDSGFATVTTTPS